VLPFVRDTTVDDSNSIPWEPVIKVPRGWADVLIAYALLFGAVYLAGPMLFRVGSENATASNFVQISKKA
jgi:hypothetical protein